MAHSRKEQNQETEIQAFELGVNFFDTADIYGRGESEEVLGAALREGKIPREEVVIASKCGIGMNSDYGYKAYDLSAGYLKASCEGSLKRQGIDYLDLYQPHRINYLIHSEETVRGLEDLKTEGKIRYIGVSNYTSNEIRALAAYTRVESLQAQFSLLHLDPMEFGLVSVCLEKKMGLLCWSPNNRGVLTGASTFAHGNWQEQREQGVTTQLEAFALAYGLTISQISLIWLMQLPGNVIPLLGTVNPGPIWPQRLRR